VTREANLYKVHPRVLKKIWPTVRLVMIESSPATMKPTPESLRLLLSHLVSGTALMWVVAEVETNNILGCAITVLEKDRLSGTSYVNIYAIYAFEDLSPALLKRSYEALEQYARSVGASRIIGYTNQQGVADLARYTGFDVSTFYMVKEL